MIFNVIGLIICSAILTGGIFYLVKEKHDKEAVKIYGTISVIGGILFIIMLLKNIFAFLG